MKKKLFALALALTLALPTVAMATSPVKVIPVKVDDVALDLKDANPYQQGELYMLPVRAVAEALGFTVTWSAEEPTQVALDNGVRKTVLNIGTDSYYMASSTAIGMSKPSPLGAAPVAINGVTFAPMELFTLLGNGAEVVEGTVLLTKTAKEKLPA